MAEYSQDIVGNIKHEPEEHFVLFLPACVEPSSSSSDNLNQNEIIDNTTHESERDYLLINSAERKQEEISILTETRELFISSSKFDEQGKVEAKLWAEYFVCGKCDFVK